MPVMPPSVLGPLEPLADLIALFIILLLLFLGNRRHSGIFTVGAGVVMLFFMTNGWLPNVPIVAGLVIFLGVLGMYLER